MSVVKNRGLFVDGIPVHYLINEDKKYCTEVMKILIKALQRELKSIK